MAIIIRCLEDVERVLDASHREIVRKYVEEIQIPLWEASKEFWKEHLGELSGSPEEIAEILQQRVLDSTGCTIYLNDKDELFKANDSLYFDESGIFHNINKLNPMWEGVNLIDDSIYEILWLRDNDCGVTYFLPKELVTDKTLKELLNENL